MKKILLATVTILAFAAPAFAAEPTKAEPPKTVGMAPASYYLTQDTATMKCQIVDAMPAAGGTTKVVGVAHPTKASAETALKADKDCKS
jgi:opacity protein-like surface antigen